MAYTYNYSILLTLLDATNEISTESVAENKQAITEVTKQIISVPDATADLAVSLGDIATAKFVLIKSNQAISVAFNALDPITGKVFLLKDVAITDIVISNDSGATAIVTVFITD